MYLVFSILSILVVIVTQATKYKNISREIEQVIIGLHLVVVSIVLTSFILPFVSMCADIN